MVFPPRGLAQLTKALSQVVGHLTFHKVFPVHRIDLWRSLFGSSDG